MSKTKVILLACAWLLFIGTSCSNEPYDILPLGIVQVQTSGTTNSFVYKDHRMSKFIHKTTTSTTTVTDTMYFHYLREGLARIVNDSSIADSTNASYRVIYVTGSSSKPQVDSAFLVTPDSQTLLEARKFSYDVNQQLNSVEVTTWTTDGVTKTDYELVWERGNVSSMRKKVVDPAGVTTVTQLSIEYENSTGVYSTDAAFLYTMPLDQLYWLSANNPVRFVRDDEEEFVYTYTYNKFGYPAKVTTNAGVQIGHTYKELR